MTPKTKTKDPQLSKQRVIEIMKEAMMTHSFSCYLCGGNDIRVMVFVGKGKERMAYPVCKKCWKMAEKIHQLVLEPMKDIVLKNMLLNIQI